jgi:hypothetical protein
MMDWTCSSKGEGEIRTKLYAADLLESGYLKKRERDGKVTLRRM